jgi:Protein of unknown function (DUF4058)
MRSRFPGMNPYLESPSLWSEVHSWIIVELARTLNVGLLPKYRAAVEKRVYEESILVGIPDVSIVRQAAMVQPPRQSTATLTLSDPILVELPQLELTIERYLEVRDVASGEVVTVVEVLSPSNKRSGEGRDQYLAKRKKLLSSSVHLVEIDLLRGGEPMPMRSPVTSDYRVLVSRLEQRSIAELYAFNLRDQLPCFLLPLRNDDPEPIVDLNIVMDVVVQSAGLEFAIDYDQAIVPTLKADDLAWVRQLMTGCLGTLRSSEQS